MVQSVAGSLAAVGEQPNSTRSVLTAFVVAVALIAVSCSSDAADDAGDESSTGDSTTTEQATTTTVLAAPADIVVVAHRGASAYAPEHTFAAYDLAVEQGADYLEQDLQMTADGELVVLHDPTLERTVRGPAEACAGAVADKTLARLRECDAGTWFNEANPDLADESFVGSEIPTLAAVLERYGTSVRYYIEIKDPDSAPGMEEALIDLLDEAGLLDGAGPDQVIIQSFSEAGLQRVRDLAPDLPLVQLVSPTDPALDEIRLIEIASYAMGIGPSAVLVDADRVAAAHEQCLVVHPYTVDDPAAMDAMLEMGVDGMFTNVPDVLVAQREGVKRPEHCGT